ncbi:zinc-ribbon domain-containing protein [Chloroflexota bacterium]
MVIGWGRQTLKDEGGISLVKCPNCGNLVEWRLVHKRVWFTLYFIPVFPYTNQHLLVCPVCNVGFKLSKEELAQARTSLSQQRNDVSVAGEERALHGKVIPTGRLFYHPRDFSKREANELGLPNLRLLYKDSELKHQREILSCPTCAFFNQDAAKRGEPWCDAPNLPDIVNNCCNTFTAGNR